MSTSTIFSVKQINEHVKNLLENEASLQNVWIKGEISNFTNHRSGHLYFSIKDSGSVIKAVMFAGNTKSLRFIPKNGTKVIIKGSINVYEPSGQYQVIVRTIQPDGVGSLHLAFEELKVKLAVEGLFDESRKRPIPTFPKRIGVLTSPTGAAVHDILTTIKRRYPIAQIVFLPVVVQGENSVRSLLSALEQINRYGEVDVLIIGRGGGSIEDLWSFNEEQVARAISSSLIPIISAVGHETDFTIADFVADKRAPTPTAAAELSTPVLLSDLKKKQEQLHEAMTKQLLARYQRSEEHLKRIQKHLSYRHPLKIIQTQQQKVDYLSDRLLFTMKKRFGDQHARFLLLTAKLDALSPLKIMNRGYSLAYKDDKMIKQTTDVSTGDHIRIQTEDGQIRATVTETIKGVK